MVRRRRSSDSFAWKCEIF